MNDRTEPLQAWARDVTQAQADLDAATTALTNDQQARAASWWTRFTGVFDTPAKRAVAQAQAAFESTRTHAVALTTAWVLTEARRAMANDIEASRVRDALQQQRAERIAQRDRIAGWRTAAVHAVHALEEAADRCRSASTMDTMDALSNNRGLSMLARSSNGSAQQAVAQARDAVAHLAQLLPQEEIQALNVSVPDGWFAFALDQGGSGFVLDLVNASSMSKAACRCDEAAQRLRPLITPLDQQLATASAAVSEDDGRLHDLDRDVLQAAVAQVPAILRGPIPDSLDG